MCNNDKALIPMPPITYHPREIIADGITDINCLTKREMEIFIIIAKGFSRKEAGIQLHIAESTIATHIRGIYRKLNISSRAEAALEAYKMGLL